MRVMQVMHLHNLHNVFNLLMDFRILKYKKLNTEDTIFPNSLYHTRVLNSLPTFLSSFS